MTGTLRRCAAGLALATTFAVSGAWWSTSAGSSIVTTRSDGVVGSLDSAGAPTPATVNVPLRIESEVTSISSADLTTFVIQTLNDPRSWTSAGFRFTADPTSAYRVVLTAPAEVDRLCRPLLTHSTVSCQNGDVVALNERRWTTGTSDWDRSIEDYRRYMVNHEVGHLVGQRHPEPRCPTKGTPAAVMEQQTKGLKGCTGNAWPLSWELERARSRPPVLAPPADWAPKPVPVNLGGAFLGTTAAVPTSIPATSTTTVTSTSVPPTSTSAPTTSAATTTSTTSTSTTPAPNRTSTTVAPAANGDGGNVAKAAPGASTSPHRVALAVALSAGGLGVVWGALRVLFGDDRRRAHAVERRDSPLPESQG